MANVLVLVFDLDTGKVQTGGGAPANFFGFAQTAEEANALAAGAGGVGLLDGGAGHVDGDPDCGWVCMGGKWHWCCYPAGGGAPSCTRTNYNC